MPPSTIGISTTSPLRLSVTVIDSATAPPKGECQVVLLLLLFGMLLLGRACPTRRHLARRHLAGRGDRIGQHGDPWTAKRLTWRTSGARSTTWTAVSWA